MKTILDLIFLIILILLSGYIGYKIKIIYAFLFAITTAVVYLLVKLFVNKIKKLPAENIFFSLIGLFLGGFVSKIVTDIIFSNINISTSIILYLKIIIALIFIYIFTSLFNLKSSELKNLFTFSSEPRKTFKNKKEETENYKILDTSVIIDGRIADISETGFLEGILIIPRFVLNELQQIADSADSLKRQRGRRGLDILNKIKKGIKTIVQIVDDDFPEIKSVDEKLIEIAKKYSAKIITNDYNLNKVAQIHGVQVLNINELANALRPIVLPGEELTVQIIREGKDPNQGVGYLEDGTMVVVEDGIQYLGKKIDVVVTSVLQTTAGRMIFAK